MTPYKRVVPVCIPLLVLLLGICASLFQFWQELRSVDLSVIAGGMTLSEDERVAQELARLAEIGGLAPGFQYPLYLALRVALPEDAVLFLVSKDSKKLRQTFAHMRVLLAPRMLYFFEKMPADWRDMARTIGRRCFLLEYDGSSGARLEDLFEQIADGADFLLWRLKVTGR